MVWGQVFRGGALHTFTIPVVDLHATVPSAYLEVSGAIVHPLSLQAARNCTLPAGGLYIAQVGEGSLGPVPHGVLVGMYSG